MVVEAHHRLLTTGAAVWSCWTAIGGGDGDDEVRCAAARPTIATAARCAAAKPTHQQQAAAFPFQFQQQALCAPLGQVPFAPAARPQMLVVGDAADSGVTFGGVGMAAAAPPTKRKRVQPGQVVTPLPVLDLEVAAADVAAQFQQQLVDVDRLVLHHTAKMWAELTEQRRRHARQVVAAVEASAAKRLRAREEEVQRLGRLNWALEERVRSLYVEAQLWRDLAHSNEATASALRGELQQALDAHAQQAVQPAGSADDDAESCCCGENDVVAAGGAGGAEEEEEESQVVGRGRRACVVCGDGAAEVLLLPCRHLCACAPCAAVATACPACACPKNGTVWVNFP